MHAILSIPAITKCLPDAACTSIHEFLLTFPMQWLLTNAKSLKWIRSSLLVVIKVERTNQIEELKIGGLKAMLNDKTKMILRTVKILSSESFPLSKNATIWELHDKETLHNKRVEPNMECLTRHKRMTVFFDFLPNVLNISYHIELKGIGWVDFDTMKEIIWGRLFRITIGQSLEARTAWTCLHHCIIQRLSTRTLSWSTFTMLCSAFTICHSDNVILETQDNTYVGSTMEPGAAVKLWIDVLRSLLNFSLPGGGE